MFELEFRVGVGVWNWRFENPMRKILIQCLGWKVEHPRGLTTWTINNVSEKPRLLFVLDTVLTELTELGEL